MNEGVDIDEKMKYEKLNSLRFFLGRLCLKWGVRVWGR